MSHSELQTIVMEQLKALATDSTTQQQSMRRDLEALSARQTESEKQLTRLSEIYTRLLPLIDSISNAVNKRPQ
jgi:molecular chaperone GrpE (heat shock protein)